MKIADGHVHTQYCPHGTNAPVQDYIERAISLGYKSITFTEHAPLPIGYIDPAPTRDSSMSFSSLVHYFEEIKRAKRYYQSQLDVKLGLEVDYIDGWEKETEAFLNEVGPDLDDSILSVHFLNRENEWFCIDYGEEEFVRQIAIFGTVEAIHAAYYRTMNKAILADLGTYKPNRIGHLTLISKFSKKYPSNQSFDAEISSLLQLIKQHGYSLDLNTAGLFKPLCLEMYPPLEIAYKAKELNIPLVYGSDSHDPSQLGQGWERFEADLNKLVMA